uniref:Uncharacterized protein n=1 Tax=Macrostomum lignano TaxID=282301 RepID=A0A1I8FEI3_9PLAT
TRWTIKNEFQGSGETPPHDGLPRQQTGDCRQDCSRAAPEFFEEMLGRSNGPALCWPIRQGRHHQAAAGQEKPTQIRLE